MARNTEHPSRRPEIERLLDDYMVEWEFVKDLPLSDIDEKRSFANQARVDQPIQQDLVETYVEGLKNGDIFPAIVVHRDGNKLVNVDGNHRFAAAKKNGESNTIAAYVIKAKAETVRILMTLLNVIHGRSLSEQEKLWHAFFLIDSGTEQTKASQVLHVPLTRLRSAYALELANRRSRDCNLNRRAWSEMNQSVRTRLAQLSTDAAFKALFDLTVKASLKGDEVSRMVTELNRLRSEKEQVSFIDAEAAIIRDRVQASAGGKIKREMSPKHSLRMHLAAIAKIKMETIPAMVNYEEGSQIAESCLAAADALTILADKLTSAPAPVER